jgi:hypothetical protein
MPYELTRLTRLYLDAREGRCELGRRQGVPEIHRHPIAPELRPATVPRIVAPTKPLVEPLIHQVHFEAEAIWRGIEPDPDRKAPVVDLLLRSAADHCLLPRGITHGKGDK